MYSCECRALARGKNIPEQRKRQLLQTLLDHYEVEEVTPGLIAQATQIDTRCVSTCIFCTHERLCKHACVSIQYGTFKLVHMKLCVLTVHICSCMCPQSSSCVNILNVPELYNSSAQGMQHIPTYVCTQIHSAGITNLISLRTILDILCMCFLGICPCYQ